MREWRFFGQYWASQISVPCQIFVSWVDYVLKIFSNKPIIFINRGFIYQVLMMVIMEIILWIKCIIFFFLYFHYVSGFCWRTNFLISVWKKIYFTSPFHHDFKGVNKASRLSITLWTELAKRGHWSTGIEKNSCIK